MSGDEVGFPEKRLLGNSLWSLGFGRAMRMGRDERPCSWLCAVGAEWYELGLSALGFTCLLFFCFP